MPETTNPVPERSARRLRLLLPVPRAWTAGWLLVLAGLCGASAAANAAPPRKRAEQCEIDIIGDTNVVGIVEVTPTAGRASVDRIRWLDDTPSSRTGVFYGRISHVGWSEIGLRVVPRRSGVLTLVLRAVWEAAGKGRVYEQVVLWDDVRVRGAALANGSFEQHDGRCPAGWTPAGGGDAVFIGRDDPPARDGAVYAVTTVTNTLSCRLEVQAARPVTVSAWARAALWDGFKDRPRIRSTRTPAHRAAARLRRGMNVAALFEVPPAQSWQMVHSREDLKRIRIEGFDHVRVPVAWHHHAGEAPAYRIDDGFFVQVDALLAAAQFASLDVILNMHHLHDLMKDPRATTNRFYRLWEQVAERYADKPSSLIFELVNEPSGEAGPEVLREVYPEVLRRIRRTNPDRTVMIGTPDYCSAWTLETLELPAADSNLIVTVHHYEPFLFTHQGASWTLPLTATTGIIYPGPPDRPLRAAEETANTWVPGWLKHYNRLPPAFNPCGPMAFRAAFAYVRDWSAYYGRPVHVGEFGCFTEVEQASRVRYCCAVRKELERLGLGWTYWDWRGSFAYWNSAAGHPMPGMRYALFSAPPQPAAPGPSPRRRR